MEENYFIEVFFFVLFVSFVVNMAKHSDLLFSEVGRDDRLIFLDFTWGPFRKPPALVKDQDFVGHGHGQAHVMLHQKQRNASLSDPPQELAETLGFDGIEP